MATPDEVTVWVGLDVGKEAHYADVLDNEGEPVFGRGVASDEADIDALLARASEAGVPGLVSTSPVRSPSSPSPWRAVGVCRSRTCRGW